jgi:hypothetical protein
LAILVWNVSKVLVDFGMAFVLGIPRDLHTADDVLDVAGTILEHLLEAYASNHGPWD